MPRKQERGANSNLQQEPVENVCISDGRQGSAEKSDLHEGPVDITDAEISHGGIFIIIISICSTRIVPVGEVMQSVYCNQQL